MLAPRLPQIPVGFGAFSEPPNQQRRNLPDCDAPGIADQSAPDKTRRGNFNLSQRPPAQLGLSAESLRVKEQMITRLAGNTDI